MLVVPRTSTSDGSEGSDGSAQGDNSIELGGDSAGGGAAASVGARSTGGGGAGAGAGGGRAMGGPKKTLGKAGTSSRLKKSQAKLKVETSYSSTAGSGINAKEVGEGTSVVVGSYPQAMPDLRSSTSDVQVPCWLRLI